MDAVTLLKGDHKTVEKLFKGFERTTRRAHKTRRELVDSMIKELSVHAAIEEQLFYPAVRREVTNENDLALDSLEEHHVVKWVLAELDGMDPEDERFAPKVRVLTALVRRHVQEEEEDLFPAVRAAMGRKRLQELGEALDQAKQMAPERPHPRSPDTPPANIVAGAVSGTVDRAREVLDRAVRG